MTTVRSYQHLFIPKCVEWQEMYKMGLKTERPVFSDNARLKPVSWASETIKNIEISLVASLDMILNFQKAYNKGADQSARMHASAQTDQHLCCSQTPITGFLA